jgi:hypothetical protein
LENGESRVSFFLIPVLTWQIHFSRKTRCATNDVNAAVCSQALDKIVLKLSRGEFKVVDQESNLF